MQDEFCPDWVSPPGDTIDCVLKERKISRRDFAKEMQLSENSLELLIAGVIKIDEELADKLSKRLGSTKKFWMRREAQYRKDKERLGL